MRPFKFDFSSSFDACFALSVFVGNPKTFFLIDDFSRSRQLKEFYKV